MPANLSDAMHIVGLALLCAACTDRAAGGEGESEAESEAEGTLQARIGPISINPLEENTRCLVLELDTADEVHVVAIEADLTATTHHLIFYRAASDAPVSAAPVPCDPFEGVLDGDAPLFIAQSAGQRIDLPTGVALRLEARQKVRIEMHYVNADAGSKDEATGTVRLHTVPPDDVDHTADLLFYGTAAFELPPGQVTQVGPDFWPVPSGADVFAMTGHTHRLGTDVLIERASAEGGPGVALYDHDAWNWEEPPLDVWDPPLLFAPGEGLRWTCTYDNWTGSTVPFGESAFEEMCFLWAYYFPADDGFQAHVAF